ncbi:MAG: M48 family metallopeptidase [Synergistaceae bacterium]|nr:M48 family metallopeptidase [Synergistaceae bacterium]
MKKKAAAQVMRVIVGFLLVAALSVTPADAKIGKDSVESAWSRIAAAAGMKIIPITYEKDDAPNAWVKFQSSNNFSVHVTQGLMRVLNSPDEIAGVLGHEVGHVKCGHYNKSVKRNVGWSVLSAILGRAGGAAEVAGAVGMNLAESGFSREQEVEADDYGMDLAVKAGYNPWGLYNAMKSFKDSGFKTEPSGFNSHPPTDRRLKHLQDRAQKIQKTPRAK